MPKTSAKANTWVSDLRRQIKREHGAGWKVQEQSGRARLFHTLEDGSRPSVTLNIDWTASNSTAIANEVGVLAARMNEHDITLKEAHHRNQQVGGVVTGDGIKAGANAWQAVGDGFLATEEDLEVDDDIDSSWVISF